MTAPIRSMSDLVEAVRKAQLEREVSYETIDALSGLQSGYTAKILGPKEVKSLGRASLGPVLGALGKALVLVDDPEQIRLVEKRWTKRKVVGGAVRQMQRNKADAPSLASVVSISERMKELRGKVKQENLSKAGKRRLKTMSKRARQRAAQHAARKRWAIAKEAAQFNDGKGAERKHARDHQQG